MNRRTAPLTSNYERDTIISETGEGSVRLHLTYALIGSCHSK